MKTTEDKGKMVDRSWEGQWDFGFSCQDRCTQIFHWQLSIEAKTNRPVLQINFLLLKPQRLICAKDWHGVGVDILKSEWSYCFNERAPRAVVESIIWKSALLLNRVEPLSGICSVVQETRKGILLSHVPHTHKSCQSAPNNHCSIAACIQNFMPASSSSIHLYMNY